MITKKQPHDWKELQQKVAKILQECGFNAEIEKTIDTVRGKVEIDVYAEEIIDGRKNIILCECKNWKQNIPQNVIHGFRSVMSDTGSNNGYIITTSDFQSGSKKANEFTNIELLTWEEFQKVFLESWYIKCFYNKLRDINEINIDPVKVQFFEDYHLIERDFFRKNIDKYHFIQEIIEYFPSPLLRDYPNTDFNVRNKLPLKDKEIYEEWKLFCYEIPYGLLEEKYFEELLSILSNYAKPVFKNLSLLNLEYNYEEYDD
jgi:hypothetical protein